MDIDLKEWAELAGVINALKDSQEVESIISAIQASAVKISPLLEQASAFRTTLDLNAIETMTKYGLSMDQAVAVLCARHSGQGVLGNAASKAISRK